MTPIPAPTLNEILTIAAVFLGPITALWVQRYLDTKREIKRKRQDLFRTIWATRTFPNRLHYRHVEALNMVGIDFADKATVMEAWKEYLDKLNSEEPANELLRPQFYKDRDEKFFALVFAISKAVGYSFTALEVEKQFYTPQAHGTWAEQETTLRKGVVSLFNNEFSLPIRIVADDQPPRA